jgi:transcriptional regulator with XRE-family HTH domain
METVRDARNKAGMTQEALAERCQCDATTISHIECDRELPSLRLFAKLSRELKMSPTKLLRRFPLLMRDEPSSKRATRRASNGH